MYDIKAAVNRLQLTADAKSTIMMRVEKALEAAGIECEVAGNSIQAPQARVPEVLRILKTLGLHYMGPQTRGNHTFNYNRTSKELGWIDYWPRRERIDFD